MELRGLRRRRVTAASIGVVVLSVVSAGIASAAGVTPTPRQVTTTLSGKNQNSTIDAKGSMIAFTSNAFDQGDATFDDASLGNGFTPAAATHPNPVCENCSNADGNGEVFLWRLKAKNGHPANSFQQITDSTGGGFSANQFPDINQKGTYIAWDSDRDLTGGNADGNREIFVYNIALDVITQVTNSTNGGDNADRNANMSDDGSKIVFDSTRDYAGVLGCTMGDGSTACNNADGNSEIMVYNQTPQKLTQVTDTTGDGATANVRARISSEGLFLSFQSTRSFSGTCTLADGTTPCDNTDGNGEIMRYDFKNNRFTQVTSTTGCGGTTANERSEISKKGGFITWQSTCEAQINASGCGSCDGNDEAFIYDAGAHRVVQLTITQGGLNRVPRVAGGGGYIVFELNRNLKNLNPSNKKILYILKRNTGKGKNSQTGPGQLVNDVGSTLTQNPKAQLVTINFSGGFNSSVEAFGVSGNGKFYSFDNGHGGVGRPNQEIWYLDRTK